MKLLAPTRPAELPADALIARLRYRRTVIDQMTVPDGEAADGESLCWVYQRLNRPLRRKLEPFLELLAMRSLVVALRYTLAGEPPPKTVTRDTLLAESLLELAAPQGEIEAGVARLETALAGDYPFVAGLTATYLNQGPGGVEQQLDEGILQHGLSRTGKGVLKNTLNYLVDMRNCLAIHKLWSWQLDRRPSLAEGGSLAAPTLLRIWARRDDDHLARIVTRLSGLPPVSDKTTAMEQCLLNGLTRLLRRSGRDPLGLGVVIEYLWRVQLAMHNRLLQQALTPDRDRLLEEVVLI